MLEKSVIHGLKTWGQSKVTSSWEFILQKNNNNATCPIISTFCILVGIHKIKITWHVRIVSFFLRFSWWRCEDLKMDPLLKASILRTLGFLLWASLSAWLFVLVEYTEIDDRQEKYHSLYSLYQFLASKYNMSLEEFNNISNIAYEALSEPKPQWTFGSAATFVLQALTTIGKQITDWILLQKFKVSYVLAYC